MKAGGGRQSPRGKIRSRLSDRTYSKQFLIATWPLQLLRLLTTDYDYSFARLLPPVS